MSFSEAQGENRPDPRRTLPAVSTLLENPRLLEAVERFSRPAVVAAVKEVLSQYRASLRPDGHAPGVKEIVSAVQKHLEQEYQQRLRPVVNATGVILHTGLGRAVLPERAAEALGKLGRFCNLEIDMSTGRRGKRAYSTERLLQLITGAEAALVVNNNAAATFLILSVFCSGKEVIVSRGQLIEIGGSYRLPDCIRASGARIREVGTTNRTHLYDYEEALSEETGAILRVNQSNYRIVGFSSSVPLEDLVGLKRKRDVLVIDDLGCGCLFDTTAFGLPPEPTAQQSIRAGADLVCFSGDKLIGGPQAGIILGKRELIARLRASPLARILRVCKLTDLALQETLTLFLDPSSLPERNPTVGMLAVRPEELRARAKRLRATIARLKLPVDCEVKSDAGAVGGGSLPALELPTYVVAIRSERLPPGELQARLRLHEPPVIARVQEDEVRFDVRTLLPGDEKIIVSALSRALESEGNSPPGK